MKRTALLLALAVPAALYTAPCAAGPLETVPEPLRPWVPWALHGVERHGCPPQYNADALVCACVCKPDCGGCPTGQTCNTSKCACEGGVN